MIFVILFFNIKDINIYIYRQREYIPIGVYVLPKEKQNTSIIGWDLRGTQRPEVLKSENT